MSEKINDGGPAFPQGAVNMTRGGLSIRDYFAASVVASYVGRVPCNDGRRLLEMDDGVAEAAYDIADAMLRARNRKAKA